jgi:phasin
MESNRKNKAEEEIKRPIAQGTGQATEALERIAAATSGAAESLRDCCTNAIKGMQDYHNRALAFAQTNANHSFELAQKLLRAKSPSEFFEVSAVHNRRQWEVIAEQAKQLGEIAQNAAVASTEPLKYSFENAFKRAA